MSKRLGQPCINHPNRQRSAYSWEIHQKLCRECMDIMKEEGFL